MKKISLLTLILTIGFMAMAQERPQDGGKDFKAIRTPMAKAVRFGLAGGINMANLDYANTATGVTDVHTNGHTSFHLGAFVNIPIGGMFRFQPGITYSGEGADISFKSGTAKEYEQSLHYINVPLVLQDQMASGIFLELGVQPGFLISAKQKDISAGSTAADVDNKKAFDGFDIGAVGGIGYLTRIGLGFNVRYNYGLANIFEDNNTKAGLQAKNRVLAIGLTYHIGAAK